MELYHIGEDVDKAVRKYADKKLDKALDTFDRAERQANQDEVQAYVMEHFKEEFEGREREIGDSLYYLTKEKVREKILSKGVRPDGRKTTDIRDIWCEVGVLPRTHGSAVFTRGQSQALSICTLGTARDAQKLDNLDDEETKRYMHQYNMPPYSTGEAKPLRRSARNRSRRARGTRARTRYSVRGRVPVHHTRRVGNPVVQRLHVASERLRLDAVAHGRGRAH